MQDLPASYDAWLTTDPREGDYEIEEAFVESESYQLAFKEYVETFDQSNEYDIALENFAEENDPRI